MWKRVVLIATAACAVSAGGAGSTEFSADRVVIKNGHMTRATLFCRDDMWRIEHNANGPIDVTIVRRDKGVMWLLMPRTKRFITLPVDAGVGPTCQHDFAAEQRRDLIGAEILQGRPTTVSEVTVREGLQDVTYYEWRAEDVQLPLRLARKDGTWIADYKNLRVRRLAAQLFELPLHYRPQDAQ